jgi:hypothetical protein
MNITPEEAAQSLHDIEKSRVAMQATIRSHRGHLFLWIWGCVWIAIAVHDAVAAVSSSFANWVSLAGILATIVAGFAQSRQIRSTIDKRFIAVCATLLLFGYGVWPVLFGGFHSYQAAFGYSTLIWMQLYIVAGIWFSNYWLWVGLVVSAAILTGFVFFPAIFWLFMLFCGVTLIGTGFYVRFFWR